MVKSVRKVRKVRVQGRLIDCKTTIDVQNESFHLHKMPANLGPKSVFSVCKSTQYKRYTNGTNISSLSFCPAVALEELLPRISCHLSMNVDDFVKTFPLFKK